VKSKVIFLSSLILITFLCLAIYTPAEASVVKWSQLPRMDQWGHDFSSEVNSGLFSSSVVADDYLCEDGLPVTKIRWWGSYWNAGGYYPSPSSNNLVNPVPGPVSPDTVKAFVIAIFNDVPAGAGYPHWSHPGIKLLYLEKFLISSAKETFYGQIDHADGQVGQGTDTIEAVFQYEHRLTDPFQQKAGSVYWISIIAIDPNGKPIQWGWHEAEDLWRGNAVQLGHCPIGWNLLTDKDMAFELEVVPIPNTLLLAATGLIGILGFKKRFKGD
jgi:hypothetical protein